MSHAVQTAKYFSCQLISTHFIGELYLKIQTLIMKSKDKKLIDYSFRIILQKLILLLYLIQFTTKIKFLDF